MRFVFVFIFFLFFASFDKEKGDGLRLLFKVDRKRIQMPNIIQTDDEITNRTKNNAICKTAFYAKNNMIKIKIIHIF